jgi:hypothetical protein
MNWPEFAVAALMLTACSAAPANDAGAPLDLAQAPHIRAGLWTIDTVSEGKWRDPTRRICDGGRPIGRNDPSGRVQWTARQFSDHEFVLLGATKDEYGRHNARIDITGDLSSYFAVRAEFHDEGLFSHPSSYVSTYRYVGQCPAGANVRGGSLYG